MAYETGKERLCPDCGIRVVQAIGKSGKPYWSRPKEWFGTETFAYQQFLAAHRCVPNPEWKTHAAAQREAAKVAREEAIAAGELVVGQRVVVFRGRNVPKGTEGVLIWVADKTDDYGNLRAGVKRDDETVVWLNFAYLQTKAEYDREQAAGITAKDWRKHNNNCCFGEWIQGCPVCAFLHVSQTDAEVLL